MIRLGRTLKRLGLRQAHVARELGVSKTALNALVRTGRPIQRLDPERLETLIRTAGASAREIETWAEPDGEAHTPLSGGSPDASEDTEMLLAAQSLRPDELEALGLARNPFAADIRSHADVWLPPTHRRVREAMWQAAQHRGLVAVYGESGSGKTVLRRDLLARAQNEDPSIIPIMPYTLGMDETQRRGEALRASDIAEMVIRRLDPEARLRTTRQGRYHQAEQLLASRVAAGQKPVLIIEEAHRMGRQTMRHLKGWAEMEAGYTGMLAIILIGQSELADLMSETDRSIREVVQRFELIRLPPLMDVGAYLRHKFGRVNADLDALVEPDALSAIQERLDGSAAVARGADRARVANLCYPLAAQNLLVISLRAALSVGRFSRLTREHVEAA